MKVWFADSHFYFALLNRNDESHERALALSAKSERLVTTQWILMEVGDGLAATTRRTQFVNFLRMLSARPDVTVVQHSPEIFELAADLYAKRSDKSWSLTDCTSFVVMRQQSITDALTADRHFEQAGFTAPLK